MSLGESAAPPATNSSDPLSGYNLPRPKPLWLNAMHAKHIVKGNFMTLSAKPKTLEQGEWVAHQGELLNTRSTCFGAKIYSG